MTNLDVQAKIDSISYYNNRYIHSGALNLCDSILVSNNFSNEIKIEIKSIQITLKKLKEPWGYWDKKESPDLIELREVQFCLNSIYDLME